MDAEHFTLDCQSDLTPAAFAQIYLQCIPREAENIFLSHSWITVWFETISQYHNPYVLTVKHCGVPVALCVLHNVKQYRRYVFSRRILYFNEIPLEYLDMFIEYNGIVCQQQYKNTAYDLVSRWIFSLDKWDEIQCNRLYQDDYLGLLQTLQHQNKDIFLTYQHKAPFADLAAQKNNFYDWSDAVKHNMSRNRRQKVNQSLALYESKLGARSLEFADSPESIERIWNDLSDLHTAYWNKKGRSGVLVKKEWNSFHRRLIAKAAVKGEVQLVKISFGQTVVGVLYNLIYDNKVYNIQSGFSYDTGGDNRLRPGFVCHYLLQQYGFEQGYSAYKFLMGGEAYKQSLSAGQDVLYDVTIRRTPVYYIEDALVFIKRRVFKWLSTWLFK